MAVCFEAFCDAASGSTSLRSLPKLDHGQDAGAEALAQSNDRNKDEVQSLILPMRDGSLSRGLRIPFLPWLSPEDITLGADRLSGPTAWPRSTEPLLRHAKWSVRDSGCRKIYTAQSLGISRGSTRTHPIYFERLRYEAGIKIRKPRISISAMLLGRGGRKAGYDKKLPYLERWLAVNSDHAAWNIRPLAYLETRFHHYI